MRPPSSRRRRLPPQQRPVPAGLAAGPRAAVAPPDSTSRPLLAKLVSYGLVYASPNSFLSPHDPSGTRIRICFLDFFTPLPRSITLVRPKVNSSAGQQGGPSQGSPAGGGNAPAQAGQQGNRGPYHGLVRADQIVNFPFSTANKRPTRSAGPFRLPAA
ncbi:hypothetical protein BDY21DRAFT_375054 [Lineolata rhizophorae]|uniref:Uncharacterized protein n=1 Tax=Lineolata rhizophorae TaxID=578093 RepID=A0A6A6NMT9_9PEZI|nr:hypothetical protein BDY21DRAFT_375054 [Lineolata rhizophorae]